MTIPVLVVLDQPLKVRGIHAKFQGAEETKAVYTTTTTDSKGNVSIQTHTAVQYVDVTTQGHLLAGNERLGFFGNLSSAVATIFGGGQHETLPPGEYPFEVEISIPEDAPSTHVGQKTRVFYELSVQVDVPLAFDLKAIQPFQLDPLPVDFEANPVRTRYPDDAGKGFFDELFGPDVTIEMALAVDKARLGDSIEGFVTMEVKKPLTCNAIRVRLVGIESSQAQNHKDNYVHKTEPVTIEAPDVISGTYNQQFALTAETTAPLSAQGSLFSIQWFVQIEFDVPWAKDPTIRAPIQLLPD